MNVKFLFLPLILSAGIVCAGANRVLLRDVTSLTLRRGEYTSGRRSSPVPQLECVGGTAYGKFVPRAVQCYNRGWDGRDVQWECKAEMSKDYQFGNIDVTCEGYDYSNDPYILAGSCGLRYELDFTTSGAKKQPFGDFVSSPHGRSWFKFENVIYILVILFVLYLLYLMFWPSDDSSRGSNQRPGGGGGGGGRPPPPGWNNPQPPPPYDDSCGRGFDGQGTNNATQGPGFFSGLGLGALGGYLFGRNTGYGGEYRYRRPFRDYSDDYDRGTYGGSGYDGSGPSTSSTHTSSGYGGTSRR